MKSIHTVIATAASAAFLTTALAQQATPPPKKEPFTGFRSSLDQRPGGAMVPNSIGGLAAPTHVVTVPGPGGIALKPEWDRRVTQATGGNSLTLDDLAALLAGYGKPERDVAAHPDTVVYEGPVLDSRRDSCRIMYLTPLAEAEEALFKLKPNPVSGSDAVMPGFPEGLKLRLYDIDLQVPEGMRYKQMTIVTDQESRVVALQLKDPAKNWHPLHWKEVRRDWHTYDFVNMQVLSDGRKVVHTRVQDLRERLHLIVVNTAFNLPPPPPVPFQSGWLEVGGRPTQTVTWYLPEPMIKLALYCLSRRKP